MLHTKFLGNQPAGSEGEDLKVKTVDFSETIAAS